MCTGSGGRGIEGGKGRREGEAAAHANKVIMSTPKPADADGRLPRLIDCRAGDARELGIERPRPQPLTLLPTAMSCHAALVHCRSYFAFLAVCAAGLLF